MPYSKSTQKDYGDNPLQKRSGFKMKGYSYPGVPPVKKKSEKTIGGESLSELITQGRVVNAPSKAEGSVDYTYETVGKTPSGKSKIKITGEKGPEGESGTGGTITFD